MYDWALWWTSFSSQVQTWIQVSIGLKKNRLFRRAPLSITLYHSAAQLSKRANTYDIYTKSLCDAFKNNANYQTFCVHHSGMHEQNCNHCARENARECRSVCPVTPAQNASTQNNNTNTKQTGTRPDTHTCRSMNICI